MYSKKTKIIIGVISLIVTIGAMVLIFIIEFKRSIVKYTMGRPY